MHMLGSNNGITAGASADDYNYNGENSIMNILGNADYDDDEYEDSQDEMGGDNQSMYSHVPS